jgi:hypothetical protein
VNKSKNYKKINPQGFEVVWFGYLAVNARGLGEARCRLEKGVSDVALRDEGDRITVSVVRAGEAKGRG